MPTISVVTCEPCCLYTLGIEYSRDRHLAEAFRTFGRTNRVAHGIYDPMDTNAEHDTHRSVQHAPSPHCSARIVFLSSPYFLLRAISEPCFGLHLAFAAFLALSALSSGVMFCAAFRPPRLPRFSISPAAIFRISRRSQMGHKSSWLLCTWHIFFVMRRFYRPVNVFDVAQHRGSHPPISRES
jgi:hypothetical protein